MICGGLFASVVTAKNNVGVNNRITWTIVILLLLFILSGCEEDNNNIPSEQPQAVADQPVASDQPEASNQPKPVIDQSSPSLEPTGNDLLSLFNVQSCPSPSANSSIADEAPNPQLSLPVPDLETLEDIQEISTRKLFDEAGYGYEPGSSFALDLEGRVYAWGQRFADWNNGSPYPIKVAGLPKINQIAGEFALSSEGSVWFMNGRGKPYFIEDLEDVTSITEISTDTLAALTGNGELWLWTVAYGSGKGRLQKVTEANQVIAVYGDLFGLYWIEQDHTVWHTPLRGDLILREVNAVKLPDGEKAVRVETTYEDDFIFSQSGSIYRYGYEGRVELTTLNGVLEITGSTANYYYLHTDGTVWGEGNQPSLLGNSDQAVGEGNPVQIQGLSNIIDIQSGENHVLALSADGHIYSWGSNMYGQLGKYPHIFEQFAPIGKLTNLQQIYPTYHGFEFIINGNVWQVDTEMEINPVLLNQQIVRKVDWDAYLSSSGAALIRQDTENCLMLSTAGGIHDYVRDNNGWIIQLSSGQIYKVELLNQSVGTVKEVRFPNNELPSIMSLVDHPFLTALAQDGSVYYKLKETNEAIWMEQIPDMPSITEWTTLKYTFFDGYGSMLRALDDQGKAYGVLINTVYDENSFVSEIKFELQLLEEEVAHLYGGLLELKNGQVVDTAREPFNDDYLRNRLWPNLLPNSMDIQLMGNMYMYGIEGPSSFRHVLVNQDGTILTYGYSPFLHFDPEPSMVLVPR